MAIASGRGFRPLTGMVLPRTAFLWRSVSFRPLAGMVLRKVGTYDGDVGFRPLTGMVPYR